MTGFAPIFLLAVGCWLLRIVFIALIPGERLPPRVSSLLGQLAPAVLAALVSVEITSAARGDNPGTTVTGLACLTGIAVVARFRPSLTISAGLGLTTIVLLDLVLS